MGKDSSYTIPGHSNWVLSVKWVDEHCVLSAGWDKVVLLWDIRAKTPQQYLYGPSICGDSLDYNQTTGQILAATYSPQQ